MRNDNTETFVCSNDRPNVFLAVFRLQHPAKSFDDLNFLVPRSWKEEDPNPPKFIVFFDNIKEGEEACKHLQRLLPPKHQNKVKWFHSIMSNQYRSNELEAMLQGDLFGLCATDSFRMVRIPYSPYSN